MRSVSYQNNGNLWFFAFYQHDANKIGNSVWGVKTEIVFNSTTQI